MDTDTKNLQKPITKKSLSPTDGERAEANLIRDTSLFQAVEGLGR